MATIDEQKYATEYTGLISTASLALGFITIFSIAFETFSRLPRDLARKKRKRKQKQQQQQQQRRRGLLFHNRQHQQQQQPQSQNVNSVNNNHGSEIAEEEEESVEDYLMAYLYRPRQFLGANRGPALPKYPLVWIKQVLSLSQDWYLRNSGLDAAVYIRFITGCWYFMLSQLFTTLIITLPLHISYAPEDVLPSSISQASVTSLQNSTTGGRNYLWVRTVLLWWQSFSWICVVIYVGWGNIRMRREQVIYPWTDTRENPPAEKDSESGPRNGGLEGRTGSKADRPEGVDIRGWRFRTVKVSNIPAHMRNEDALRNYLDTCLAFLKRNPSVRFFKPPLPSRPESYSTPQLGTDNNNSSNTPAHGEASSPTSPRLSNGEGTPRMTMHEGESEIKHVVIVRKLTELHGLVKKRREVLHELESAHVLLAREVMQAVAYRIREKNNALTLKERIKVHLPSRKKTKLQHSQREENLDMLVNTLAKFLPVDSKERALWKAQKDQEKLGNEGGDSDDADELSSKTIWESLTELPQETLDSYQPVTKLKFFRGQIAPSIDLYLTKLNLLTSLIEELRAKPDSYAACDTAFVTFKKASDARLAKTELSWIRARGLTCRVRMAPDVRDLDWDKLVESSFRGDMVRAFITHAAVWLGTFFWILPISALIGLVSLDNLSTRIPALADWLANHAKAKSLASSLIPTVIVTITNMLIPTIMIQVSGRAQTFVTFSKLHHATWCRYWKWVIINVVIAFCVGTALFTSLLGIFTGETFEETEKNPLSVIANSFSNGAVFFVSYTILVIATQCFFELAQFMIPWFLFLGVRKATTPRQRFVKTEGRRFFSYTVGPNHTLIIAIILVFSLLNPLPICFVFLYFSFACVIFRDHFARLYWRVYYEQYGRLFYIRIMRYSLDALVLGQVVNMSLFFVLKNGTNGGACAALIPITIIIKLLLTRWYDYHMDAADAAYADVISGQATAPGEADSGMDKREGHAGRKSRRLTVNERLKSIKLPELSLRATLSFPMAGRSTLKAKHGPQAVLQRLTKRLQDSGAYSELQDVVARDATTTLEESNAQAAKDLAAPSAEKTLTALENPISDPAALDRVSPSRATARTLDRPEVIPHQKLQRDDRPDHSAAYMDPYLTEPLEPYLWLPRDPLYPIDLDDTIEWYGKALVSSEGGNGQIGTWTAMTEDNEELVLSSRTMMESPIELLADQNEGHEDTSAFSALTLSPSKGLSRSPSNGMLSGRRLSRVYDGSERIRIPEEVKSRHLPDTFENDLPQVGTSAPPGTVRRQPSSTSSVAGSGNIPPQAPLLPRSASVSQGLIDNTDAAAEPTSQPTEFRRARSEILDASEKSRVRRPTILSPAKPEQNRGRSTSDATSHSRTGEISQSRALAHEAILEERKEAVARRQQEDNRMLEKVRNSKRSWRNWFFKAPDDAD